VLSSKFKKLINNKNHMDSGNIYYRIYQQKTTKELSKIILDNNLELDSRLISIQVLEDRSEISEDIIAIKLELTGKKTAQLKNEIASDRYDTFSSRLGANMIDGFIFRIVRFLIGLLSLSGTVTKIEIVILVSFVFPYLYTIILQGLTGQTVGKMLMGIKIYDKNEKVKISFSQAIMRDIIPLGLSFTIWALSMIYGINDNGTVNDQTAILFYIIIMWSILEIITLFFNKRRRALHDIIAGTVVLKIRER
jgi:uncharacterized RDD family membrane protein YckC